MSGIRRTLGATSATLLVLVGMVVVAPSASAVHVSCGQTIVVSTVLDRDLNCAGGHGVIIGADNITFDLGGHTITGPGPNVSVNQAGVYLPDRTGVTVRNGTVRSFAAGVAIDGGSNNTVADMRLINNVSLRGDFGEGIGVYFSDGNTLRGNLVQGNGPWAGISLLVADNNTVDRNSIIQNNRAPGNTAGIRLENVNQLDEPQPFCLSSDFNLITNNLVQQSATFGIQLFACSIGNVLRYNQTILNPLDGIAVFAGSVRNVIENNASRQNGRFGIFLQGPVLPFFPNGTQGNQVIRNQAFLNTTTDLRDGNNNCTNNVWRGNQAQTGNPPCTLQQ